jgi:magnesium-transporting ATPase (P-type)
MSIINDSIFATKGFTNEDVIKYGYLCSNADKKDDPIDKAIVTAFAATGYNHEDYEQTEIIGFNPSVKRVVSFCKHKPSGKIITIAKGLPAKILDTAAGALDDHELQWKCQRVNDRRFVEQVKKVDTGFKHIWIQDYRNRCMRRERS